MELYETKENRGQDVKGNVTGSNLEGVPRWEGGLVRSRGSGCGRIIIRTPCQFAFLQNPPESLESSRNQWGITKTSFPAMSFCKFLFISF